MGDYPFRIYIAVIGSDNHLVPSFEHLFLEGHVDRAIQTQEVRCKCITKADSSPLILTNFYDIKCRELPQVARIALIDHSKHQNVGAKDALPLLIEGVNNVRNDIARRIGIVSAANSMKRAL